MLKKVLILFATLFALLLILPETANATEECPRDHTRKCAGYICDFCDALVPADSRAAHTYKITSTENCTTVRECIFCGKTTMSTNHNYQSYLSNCRWVTRCNNCGEKSAPSEPHHNYKIVGTNYVCKDCGHTKSGAPHEHTGTVVFGFISCDLCHQIFFTPLKIDITALLLLSGLSFMVLIFIFAIRLRGSQSKASVRFRKRVPTASDPASVYWGMVSNEPDIIPDLPAPRARKTGTETGNSALALHLLKEEDERPQD